MSGRVQGVFYRGSAQAHARKLEVTGYARNLSDGRVEVLACGEPLPVGSFIEWLKVGPVGASVTEVKITEHDPGAKPSTFTIA